MAKSSGMDASILSTITGPDQAKTLSRMSPSDVARPRKRQPSGRLSNIAVAVPGMYLRKATVAMTWGAKTFRTIAST